VFNAPQPRSRLYTTAAAYAGLLSGGLFSCDRGGAITELERALADYLAIDHVIAVPQARVGIYLTIKHLVRRGRKVILSPYTIADVVNMVVCAGAVPVFADIVGDGSCNIDPNAVADLLDRERDVGAVMVTHFYGLACKIEPIREACARAKVPLIEDAAQAFGAKTSGKLVGTVGQAGIFSFGLLKNITGFLGGAVATGDPELAPAIRAELESYPVTARRDLWKKAAKGAAFDIATEPAIFDSAVYWLFRHAYLQQKEFFKNQLDTDANPVAYTEFPKRYACRMSDAQAAIIRAQLSRCEAQSTERISKAAVYRAGLKDVAGLTLPPFRQDGSHIYLYYTILARDRDGLARSMTRQYRDVQVSHHRNCASLSCYAQFSRSCPNAETASQQALYLPTYPGYRLDQVEANIAAIRRYAQDQKWT
jgi:perosamine synthetase